MDEEFNLPVQNLTGQCLYDGVVVIIVKVAKPVDDVGVHEVGHTIDGGGEISRPTDVL